MTSRAAPVPGVQLVLLAAAGAVLSGAAAYWAFAGDQTRTVVWHLCVYAAAFGAYAVALRAARGLSARGLRLALAAAVLWRVALVPGPPLLSDDVYRYVWEGRIQHHGGNPYVFEQRPAAETWRHLRDDVWSGVNWKEYTAIYPPGWQLAARAVTAWHDSVAAMKLFLVACELALWWALARLLRRRRAPPERILVAAWSPLALVEIAGSGHNESFGLLLLALALLALESGRVVRAAAAAALAFQAKLLPGLVAAAWLRRLGLKGAAVGAGVSALLAVPYADAGADLWRSLAAYGRLWLFNETGFALLSAVLPGRRAVAVGAGLALLGALALLLAWRRADPAAAGLALVVAFLLVTPSVLPWYALWVLPFVTLSWPGTSAAGGRWPRAVACAAWTFTGTVSLAYLVYPGWLAGGPWQVGWAVRVAEYLPCVAVALWFMTRPPPPGAPREGGDVLVVFVKEPRPGAVKTRLARSLGDERAARIYRRLAEAEIRNTAPVATGRPDYERVFFFAPPDASPALARWLGSATGGPVSLEPQAGGDLGQRMAAAFAAVFAHGARRVAVIGTDVPACSRAHVAAALRSLDRHDLAVGPTRDGGYYLLALDRPRPELFEGIAWSTPAVLGATLARAAALGLRVHQLETLDDVDTVEDWRRLGWPEA